MSVKVRIILYNILLLIASLLVIFAGAMLVFFMYSYRYKDNEAVNILWALFHNYTLFILILIIAVLIISNFILLYLITKKIIEPIKSLKTAANKIKDGNLTDEIQLQGDLEIREMGIALDDLRLRLKDSKILAEKYEKDRNEMIANISHDLKTPVTAIKGFAQGLLEGVAKVQNKEEKYIRTIYKKADEMDKMVSDLFLLSKLTLKKLPFIFTVIDFNGFLSDLVNEACDININLKPLKQAIPVKCDADKLKRVFINIINNSIKYKRGVLLEINIEAVIDGNFVVTQISDNGAGIKSSELAKIFDSFYRSDKSRNNQIAGSGLGLSIAKQIILEHRGSIWIKSIEGVGTEVYIKLPMVKSE